LNLRVVSRYLSSLLVLLALFLGAPLALAVIDNNTDGVMAYGITTSLVLAVAGILRKVGLKSDDEIHRKDAFGVVAFIWLALGLFGGLPFYLEGAIPSFISSVFEAVSGFTTTGATVVADVDSLSRSTKLWRCLSHWIGGMGIVVLFVAVFPQMGVGAKQLFRTEVPGPVSEGLKPRIRQTALRLWWIYATLTAVCLLLLHLAGMDIYESFCHAFSILSTGGFSTRSASIGGFDNETIDWITIVFMLIGGINFGLYYSLIKGELLFFWKNYEMRFFVTINILVGGAITFMMLDRHGSLTESLRQSFFQTLAVTTTTGLMTEDFDTYPNLARFLLFVCMFIGGSAGSTAGGLKVSRIFVMYRAVLQDLKSVLHPQAVYSLRIGGGVIPHHVVSGILLFFSAYFLLFALGSITMVFLGLDLITAMSSVVACLSSVGPGLAGVGPSQNYEFIPAIGKMVLSFCMIAGRLEIFVLFAVFNRECWRR